MHMCRYYPEKMALLFFANNVLMEPQSCQRAAYLPAPAFKEEKAGNQFGLLKQFRADCDVC